MSDDPRTVAALTAAAGHRRGTDRARLEEPVELAPLREDAGLGRVHVLGLAVVEHTAAEADDLAALLPGALLHSALHGPAVWLQILLASAAGALAWDAAGSAMADGAMAVRELNRALGLLFDEHGRSFDPRQRVWSAATSPTVAGAVGGGAEGHGGVGVGVGGGNVGSVGVGVGGRGGVGASIFICVTFV